MSRRSKKITHRERACRIEESDEQLIKRFQAGQREAFDELVHRHQEAVYDRAYRILGNRADAKEATQETFIHAFTKLHQFHGESFKNWLLQIARNEAINIIRNNIRWRDKVQKAACRPTQETPTVEAPLLDDEKWALIVAVFQRHATARMWKICVLYYEENLPLHEIAAILKTTIWQVRQNIAKIIARIREELSRQGWSVD